MGQGKSTNKAENNNNASKKEDEVPKKQEPQLHESWSDELLYSRTGNKVCKEDFELLTVIGRGSFGKVMQVRKKNDGNIYAMKVLTKQSIIARKQVAHTKAEKTILERVQHPFIVKLYYAFQSKEKLYMILEYVNGGELFLHLKKYGRLSEDRARFYAAEIVCALIHLHKLGIIYRDLKPENLLVGSDGHIIMTDFGLAKEVEDEEGGTRTFCGTPEYLAPEVLKRQEYNKAVDWWSLGTLLYEMLTGMPPFYSKNVNSMYQKILTESLRFPSYVSAAARNLLEGLLNKNPEERMGSGLNGAENIKNHEFFKNIDWEKLEKKEIPPPFIPKVSGKEDTSQIDEEFTREKVVDSVPAKSLSPSHENDFEGFTYVGSEMPPSPNN